MSKMRIAGIVIGTGCAAVCVWGLWGVNVWVLAAFALCCAVVGACVGAANADRVNAIRERAERKVRSIAERHHR